MKLEIKRQEFLKSWQIAEKITNAKSTLEGVKAILIKAGEDGTVTLEATDMKSSVICQAEGVKVLEAGSALANASLLGNMMRKFSVDDLTLEFDNVRGLLTAGTSKIRVAGLPFSSFPDMPKIQDAEIVCEIMAADLSRLISEAGSASSQPQDFPRYMGAILLQTDENLLKAVATDGKRLSLSKIYCDVMKPNEDIMIPSTAIKEFGKTIATYGDAKVSILAESSTVWFKLDKIDFAIRRIDSVFPNYERILTEDKITTLKINAGDLASVLDRIDIIAKTTPAHIMAMALQTNGEIRITARAPEIGTASEILFATVEGSYLQVGFNVGYFQDGLKALGQGDAVIEFSGEEDQARMYRDGSDNFLYMLMPARLTQQDSMTEAEIGDFRMALESENIKEIYDIPDAEINPENFEQNNSEQENFEQGNSEQQNNFEQGNSEQADFEQNNSEQNNPEQGNFEQENQY